MKNVEKYTEIRKIKINCITFFVIGFVFLFLFIKTSFAETENSTNFSVQKNQNPIDIDKILEENIRNKKQEEMTIEETDLEYTTIYRNNDKLPSGTMQVVQEGRTGKQNVVVIKKYDSGEIVNEETVANNLIKASVNKIVEVGTGNGKNNYIPKVKDKVYVTSNLLAVRLKPDSNSEKICTLKKDNEVIILGIEGEWLYINSTEKKGYIPKDCITNVNPNLDNISNEDSSKNNLVNKNIDFNMNLNIPSNLSLEQFEKLFENEDKDKNNVFKENARYFYYIEKQYNINGIFVAAVGIHESGWGTSKISVDKKNLFGYGAVDSNPYGGAYNFSTYAEGIDLLSRVFVKYYLNPEGTAIYEGNIASGRFYNGNTLSAVNTRYASDKNWAASVYEWIKYLYNKI